mgnify:CR=1 FL=1
MAKVAFQLDLAEFEANRLGVIAKSKDSTNVDCDPACVDRITKKGSLRAY